MAITTRIVSEDAFIRIVEESDPTGYVGRRIELKSGPLKNQQDAETQLASAAQATRDRITAARATKNAAMNTKQLSFTTLAEGRTALRALCDVVNDLAQEVIDTNQAQLRLLRYVLEDFSTPPE